MAENLIPKAFELCASDNIEEFKKIVPEKVKINAKVSIDFFLTISIKTLFSFFTEDTSYLLSRK